jgi:hypothetical protein
MCGPHTVSSPWTVLDFTANQLAWLSGLTIHLGDVLRPVGISRLLLGYLPGAPRNLVPETCFPSDSH